VKEGNASAIFIQNASRESIPFITISGGPCHSRHVRWPLNRHCRVLCAMSTEYGSIESCVVGSCTIPGISGPRSASPGPVQITEEIMSSSGLLSQDRWDR
jgi:hypothetical protein